MKVNSNEFHGVFFVKVWVPNLDPYFSFELILDGDSEIGVHVLCEIDNSIYLRHLFRSITVANLKSIS